MSTISEIAEHYICYMGKKEQGKASSYPKCEICDLPGHEAKTCRPLINIAIGQAFLKKNPAIMSEILRMNSKLSRGHNNRGNKGGKSKSTSKPKSKPQPHNTIEEII